MTQVLKWVTRIFLGLFLLAALIVAGGAAYEALSRNAAWKDFPPPGQRVDVGGRKIQIDCRGQGSPTLLLIHGFDSSGTLAFSSVHDDLARISRTCAISRAGIMWSDPDPRPFTAEHQAEDMHNALKAAGETGPFILVPHSLGGPYALVYTSLYPEEVAGYVLIDTSHPDQIPRFQALVGDKFSPSSQDGQMALGSALAWTGLTRWVTRAGAGPNGMPRNAIAASAAFLPMSVSTLLRESKGIPRTFAEANEARGGKATPFGDRPLIILTAGLGRTPEEQRQLGVSAEEDNAILEAWKALGAEQASWSTCGRQEVVANAPHYIQFAAPDRVVAAASEIVTRLRSTDTGASGCK